MTQFKKILIWSILNERHHPLAKLDDKKLKSFSPIIETLFPGMSYTPRPGFSIINRRFFAPVLQKIFPEIEGMDPSLISQNDMVEIQEPFLACQGYEYDTNPEWQKQFDQLLLGEKNKQINKEATIQNILNWASSSIGHSIDVQKFNEKMDGPDWENFLIEAAEFCKVEVVYL